MPDTYQDLSEETLSRLFLDARSQNGWQDRPVPDDVLHNLWDILKMGPTSANCSPGRFVFVRSEEGKEKLRPTLSGGNLDKTMTAPVCVIVAYDPKFYDHLPELFPHTDARPWFTGSEQVAYETAFRNGTLMGGYLMLAARALGLDVGPMSGFDAAQVEDAFLSDTGWKANFLCNLGYGDPAQVYDRLPRLPFETACRMA
ncbi:malonic semialdehyde reductase [Palleronia sp. LCG004]|uniref:malonic semialdehyde reductase n=1 Tax=Palleronia sp. LCG004 TaxID=3079304 RepID=UPI0029438D19|nr:malonic semialdehyde reductase [Palleronia sp. LCG004]WOI58015.1 malonic semialdehyde reductase [Palleronia sp. LCG004]